MGSLAPGRTREAGAWATPKDLLSVRTKGGTGDLGGTPGGWPKTKLAIVAYSGGPGSRPMGTKRSFTEPIAASVSASFLYSQH